MELSSHVSYITRSSGSIHSYASYIARDERVDELTGEVFNQPLKSGESHIATGMLYPDHFAPRDENGATYAIPAEDFWNWYQKQEDALIEHRYRRSPHKIEGMKAKSILTTKSHLSLHNALSPKAAMRVVEAALREMATDRGMAVEYAIHDQKGNLHFHFQMTARMLTDQGVSNNKPVVGQRALMSKWSKELREAVARHQNIELAALGIEGAHVEHLSFEDRGIKIAPQIHEGWYQRWLGEKAAKQERETGIERDRSGIDAALSRILAGDSAKDIVASGISRPDYNKAIEIANSRRPAQQIAESVIAELTANKATFTEAQFAGRVFELSGGNADILADAQRHVLAGGAIHLGQDADGRERFTSHEYMAAEKQMFASADALKSAKSNFKLDLDRLDRNIDANYKYLDGEQREAIKLMTSTSQLAIIAGRAGSGKTSLVKAAADEIAASGYEMRGFAIAGEAARKLQIESGIASGTLASWSVNEDRYNALMAQVEAGGSMSAAQRKEMDRLAAGRIKSGQVIFIDEAGMVDVRTMSKILTAAEQVGARVILLGDDRQFAAIGAGDALRGLMDRHTEQVARVEDIKRQRKSAHADWMLPASMAFSADHITDGLQAYEDHGRIKFSDTRTDARGELAAKYLADFDAKLTFDGKPATQLAMAYTREDVSVLNDLIRAGMVQRGVVAAQGIERDGKQYAVGDRIVFTKPEGGKMVRDLGTADQNRDWMAEADIAPAAKREKSHWQETNDRLRAEQDERYATYLRRRGRAMRIASGFVGGLDGLNKSLLGAALRGAIRIYYDAYRDDIIGSKRERAKRKEIAATIKEIRAKLDDNKALRAKIEVEIKRIEQDKKIYGDTLPARYTMRLESAAAELQTLKAEAAVQKARLTQAQAKRDKMTPRHMRRELEKAKARDEAERIAEAAVNRGVTNGTVGTLIGAADGKFVVQLDPAEAGQPARVVAFDPSAVNTNGQRVEIDHGFAVTMHKSQGATIDLTYGLASKYMRSDAAYVLFTRHAHDMHLYADREEFADLQEMQRALAKGPDKDLAEDYKDPKYQEIMAFKDANQSYTVRLGEVIERAAAQDLEPFQMPEWQDLMDEKKARTEQAKKIVENYGDYRTALRNARMSLDQLEVMAGIREAPMTDSEKEALARVSAWGALNKDVRAKWQEIAATHPGAQSRAHSDFDAYDAMRQARDEGAYKLTIEDGGREAHRRWSKKAGVSWKQVETNAQAHVDRLKVREIAATPEGAAVIGYAEAKSAAGRASAKAKEAGVRIDTDAAYISARDARDQAVLALAEKLRAAGIDPANMADDLKRADLRTLAEAKLVRAYIADRKLAGSLYGELTNNNYDIESREGARKAEDWTAYNEARARRNAAAIEIEKNAKKYAPYIKEYGIDPEMVADDAEAARTGSRDKARTWPPVKIVEEEIAKDAAREKAVEEFALALRTAKVSPEGFAADLAQAELRSLANTPEAATVRAYQQARQDAGIYTTLHRELYGDRKMDAETRKGVTGHARYGEYKDARDRRNAAVLEIAKELAKYERFLTAAGIDQEKLEADIKAAQTNQRDQVQTKTVDAKGVEPQKGMPARGAGQSQPAPQPHASAPAVATAPSRPVAPTLAELVQRGQRKNDASLAVMVRDDPNMTTSTRIRAGMERLLLSKDAGDSNEVFLAHYEKLKPLLQAAKPAEVKQALDKLAPEYPGKTDMLATLRTGAEKIVGPLETKIVSQAEPRISQNRSRSVQKDRDGPEW